MSRIRPGSSPRSASNWLAEPLADRAAALEQAVLLDRLDRRQPGAAGDRVAAEGAGVHPRLERRGDLGPWRSSRPRRCRRPGPWRRSGCRARCSSAGRRTTRRSGPCRSAPRRGSAARRARRRACAGPAGSPGDGMLIPPSPWIGSTRTAAVWSSMRRGDGVEVVVGDVGEAGDHRLEARVILGLGRRGQGGVGPAVEAALHRDDLEPARGVAVGPGQLDRRLVGLGAAVAEEALAAERPLRRAPGRTPPAAPCTRCSARGSAGRPARGPPRRPAAGSGPAGCSPSRGRSRGSGSPRRPRPTTPRPGPGRPGYRR